VIYQLFIQIYAVDDAGERTSRTDPVQLGPNLYTADNLKAWLDTLHAFMPPYPQPQEGKEP
jgi:hypothetical protein